MIFECDTEERYLGSAGEITGICVSRPVNGITQWPGIAVLG